MTEATKTENIAPESEDSRKGKLIMTKCHICGEPVRLSTATDSMPRAQHETYVHEDSGSIWCPRSVKMTLQVRVSRADLGVILDDIDISFDSDADLGYHLSNWLEHRGREANLRVKNPPRGDVERCAGWHCYRILVGIKVIVARRQALLLKDGDKLPPHVRRLARPRKREDSIMTKRNEVLR